MIYKRLLVLAVLATLSGGCANTYSIARQQQGDIPRLSITDTFCIAVNATGDNYDKIRSNPGLLLSNIVRSSLEERGIVPETENPYLSFYEALMSARAHDCDYIVYSTILRWDDHSAAFDGVPNRVEVRIRVIDAASAKDIDGIVLKAESGHLFSVDQPQDLLAAPVEKYLSGLFKANESRAK